MAKKRSPVKIRSEDVGYRWECLKQDPDFLRDHAAYREGKLAEANLCEKWELLFLPDDLQSTNPLGDTDVPVRLVDVITDKSGPLTVIHRAVPVRLTAIKNESGSYNVRGSTVPETRYFLGPPKKGKRLLILLNPEHPTRLILTGIRALLGEKKGAKRAKRTLNLRLLVYNRFQGGESITQIAQILERPVPTIWRAWLEAHRDIHGVLPPHKKRLRRLTGFDAKTHIKGCETCLNAKSSVEEFCALMRDDINKNCGSQRELTRGDTYGATEEKEAEEEQDETM